ncbi:MAG: hypothetical protein H0V26_09840 [Solirubrobacterales bacterium]|nr:hypothetical protein [Solirubrobacterales bacterium]
MKWAKPTPNFPINSQPEKDFDLTDDSDDFNAPLSEQNSRGGTTTCEAPHSEIAIDALDVEEAERRLADPDDKAKPFKAH